MTSLLPSRSTTGPYGTPASKLVVATQTQVLERHVRGATRDNEPIAQGVRSDRLGRLGVARADCTHPVEAPGQLARAFWRSKASLTESSSGTSRQSDSSVDLRTRLTPGAAVGDGARDGHLFGLQVEILDEQSKKLFANSRPTVWLHFWLHSHRRPGLFTPTHGCDLDIVGGGEGTRTLEPPDCQSGALPTELRPRGIPHSIRLSRRQAPDERCCAKEPFAPPH